MLGLRVSRPISSYKSGRLTDDVTATRDRATAIL
jgi:hypothetical protein